MINLLRTAALTAAAVATAIGGAAALPAYAATHDTGTVVSRLPLTVRAAPTTASAAVGSLKPGATVQPACKVNGPNIDGNPRWYRLGNDRWVAARYVANDGAAPGWCASGSRTPTASTTAAWCTSADLHASVAPERGGGSAGHYTYAVRVRNTSDHPCMTQGYPGVSLVGHGNGTQLGAAADRVPASAPRVVLKPGQSAQADLLVADAYVYDNATCHRITADGFRVYPPDERAALYAPIQVAACSSRSVHQLQIKPFHLAG